MPSWQWVIADTVAFIALACALGLFALWARRRLISRSVGTFELSVRLKSQRAGRGWVFGVGRYAGEDLEWFRVFSLSMRPKLRLTRGRVSISGRRTPVGPEAYALYADHEVLVLARSNTERDLELAMSRESMTGFLSWLEASPPGHLTRTRH